MLTSHYVSFNARDLTSTQPPALPPLPADDHPSQQVQIWLLV